MKTIFHFPKSIAGLLLSLLLITGMTLHHGWANYDQDTELDYTGIILENEIGNPHTYINLEVTGEEEMVWEVVLAPLSRMRSRGLTDDAMLAEGETVRVVGYPHRSIEDEMRAERIIIGDTTIELR